MNFTFFPDIWIVGDSLIDRAKDWASAVQKINLNLDSSQLKVQWFGFRGMQWHHLRSQIQWISLHATPKMIVIHVGGNNVVRTRMQKMKRIMYRDFKYLFELFPDTIIVWSEILPRLFWKFAPFNSQWRCWDRKRVRFNQLGRQMVSINANGRILKHDITADCSGLFAADRCHLSNVGNALFCNSLQAAIEFFLSTQNTVFGP